MSFRYEIRLSGAGGQGLILVGKILAEAAAIYDKGLEIDPLNPPMAINVAINLSTLGDFDRAEKLLLRLAYLPEPPNLIYYNLRSFYRQWGRLDKVIYWWQESLRAVQGKLVAGGRNNNWLGLASLHHGEAYAMLGLFEEERPGLA